jgi:UPF0716 protein FxsA
MRRLLLVFALLVVAPIVEIAVLIAVGRQIGPAPTILLVLATSALGAWLLRREGGRAWRAFRADLVNQVPPGVSATDGLLVLLGGVFMLVPGFVSDLIGLVLILPPTRRVARGLVMNVIARRLTPAASTSLFGPRRVRARAGRPRPTPPPPGSAGPTAPTRPAGPSVAIEGEVIDPAP